MKNLKRILLTVIAGAITLQAQAGISEYISQSKAFAYNHSGKIAIGVGLAIIASGVYYYMRSKKAHTSVNNQASRPNLVNSAMSAAHNKTTQQIDESQMRVTENQPEIEQFIIYNENDIGDGVEYSDNEEPSNENNDDYEDNFKPSIFNDDSDVEPEQRVQESINLGESFVHLPASGELTDSFFIPEVERVDRHQHIAIAIAVDPVKNILGRISQQINIMKNNLNDASKVASAVNAIKSIYDSKPYPIESAVINPVAAQGLNGVIKNIIDKPSDRNYDSLIEEYERSINSLRYIEYQEQ